VKVKIWDFVILVEGLFIKVTLEPMKTAVKMRTTARTVSRMENSLNLT
jgi:hypothetical protein